jgi:hypothetical protein
VIFVALSLVRPELAATFLFVLVIPNVHVHVSFESAHEVELYVAVATMIVRFL